MARLVFALLLASNFLLFSCEGKIFPPDSGNISVVPPGGNLTIAWKIDPAINVSDLNIREWVFLPTGETVAEIIADEDVTIKSTTFFALRIEIIKPSTLVLKNVDKRFNGKYQFEIRYENLRKQGTSIVDVVVAVTPVVSVNCSSSTTLNENEYFLCECKGERGTPAPANVTWYKDNQLIVTGKKEAILRLSNVDKNDSGIYRCEANSGFIETTNETTIKLIVNYKPINPTIMITPREAEVIYNSEVNITCNSDGFPEPSYNITYNDIVLTTSKTYSVSKVKWRDEGTYTCISWNKLGTQSASANLTLDKPTLELSCSGRIRLNEGGNFVCRCKSEGGNVIVSVIWYNGRDPIGNPSYGEKTLSLTNVVKQDSGKYKCVGRSYNLSIEKSIEIEVLSNEKPTDTKIDIKPKEVEVGGEVTLTCSSTGFPDPSFTITHVSTKTVYNGKMHQISKAAKSDKGAYICTATNIAGSEESEPETLAVLDIGDESTSKDKDPNVGMIIGIVISVLVLFAIVIVVVWRYKSREKDGYRGNADVSPGEGGEFGINHYELDGEPSGGADNTYATVSSETKSKPPPESTTPDVYASVNKENRDGKPLYATLDSVALAQGDKSKKKPKDERPPQTEYASIDFLKSGKNDEE